MKLTSGGYPLGDTQAALTEGVRIYYDRQRDDRNLLLAGESTIVNHHFGLGDFDRSLPLLDLEQPEIADRLHGLELNQIDILLSRIGTPRLDCRVLDAGCGRGGTSFSLAERFGARVEGVTISTYQQRFASLLAERAGLADRVGFHVMNYLALDFAPGTFDFVITNETTQYVLDMNDRCGEFARVLAPGGRYLNATWCLNEDHAGKNEFEDPINLHYGTSMNTRQEYLEALDANGFAVRGIEDHTLSAIPYWELRCHWQHRSGIETAFLEGHRSRKILYLIIDAERR